MACIGCKREMSETPGDGCDNWHHWSAKLCVAEDESEHLRVQLAGCGVAALGGVGDRASVAKRGDYGWSASYQDVVDLRVKYEALLERYLNDAP